MDCFTFVLSMGHIKGLEAGKIEGFLSLVDSVSCGGT